MAYNGLPAVRHYACVLCVSGVLAHWFFSLNFCPCSPRNPYCSSKSLCTVSSGLKGKGLPSAVHDRACGKGYEEVSPEGKVLSKLGDVFSRLGSKGLSRVSFLFLFLSFFS